MQRRKPMTVKHQERRRRALERFSIDKSLSETRKGYTERKYIEFASLQTRLGTKTA